MLAWFSSPQNFVFTHKPDDHEQESTNKKYNSAVKRWGKIHRVGIHHRSKYGTQCIACDVMKSWMQEVSIGRSLQIDEKLEYYEIEIEQEHRYDVIY